MLETSVQLLGDLRVAYVVHRGAYPQIGRAFERLVAWAGPRGLFATGRSVGVFYDDPRVTPEADLRSAACVEVGPGVGPDAGAGVEVMTIPGGRYAVGVLKGSYERLPEAWAWMLRDWMPARGLVADQRPCFEVYLNSPMHTPREELATAIHVPVKV